MADPTFFDLFKATWAQSGLTEGITELQYKTGWAFIGSVPPSVEQFNKVQQTTDERLAWIYKQLDGLAVVTGRPLAANGFDALSYALQNLNATNLKSGTVPVARLSGVATALTAGAAQKLATARTIATTGDATGSGSFDGSANLSLGLTLSPSGVTAGSYGNANAVPTFTVDAKGRVSAAGEVAVGNASTATKLATARSFSITGGATAAGVSFDGSGNVSFNVTALDVSKATVGTLPVARGGTGVAAVAAGAYLTGAGTGALVSRTPAQVLEDIQALPKAGGDVSGPIFLGAGAAIGTEFGVTGGSARSAQILFPDGGGYSTGAASVTGAFKITLPNAAIGVNSMIRLRVDIYEYRVDASPVSVLIQGYVQSSKVWSRCGATIVAGIPASDIPIRFGSDGAGNLCIWLGDVGNLWQYPTITVAEVLVKYNAAGATISGWGAGWKVEPVTAFETVAITLASDNLAFARSDLGRVSGLQAALDLKANTSVQIVAGNGMTGGGSLAGNRTLVLGTPSTLTTSTTNAVQAESHTHAIQISPADIGAPATSLNLVAGNGLSGGGTLAANRTFALGTPSRLSAASTNAVTTTSHTHELDTQATPNDTTAGRILTVGNAFGIGADNQLGTVDLDTVLAPGKYGQTQNANATTARHYPVNKAGSLEVGMAGAQITTQTYVLYDTGEMYSRGRYNAVWSDWAYHPGVERFPKASESVVGIAPVATQAETDAGNNDTKIVTPKKLRWGISFSIGENGHLALPSWMGGLIIQWGSGSVALNTASGVYYTGIATATLSIPFPKNIFGIFPAIQNTPNSLDTIAVAGSNLSSISLIGATTDNGFQVPKYWYFVIGN